MLSGMKGDSPISYMSEPIDSVLESVSCCPKRRKNELAAGEAAQTVHMPRPLKAVWLPNDSGS